MYVIGTYYSISESFKTGQNITRQLEIMNIGEHGAIWRMGQVD